VANTEKKIKKSDEDILRVARERFTLAEEAEREIRQVALEDLEFRTGNQWPADVRAERERDHRPCLTINRMPQFIRQITNDQRQNRPSIKVFPVDDKGDIETAKIFQGLIRHIEYNSNADIAYDTAFEGAVIKSFGYYRIITDYIDAMSFDQEILIKRIRNHFSVYMDPHSKEPDGSDANWAFIFEDVPKDDFKADNPDAKLSAMDDWVSVGNQMQGWVSKSAVRVAEYFYKEHEEVEICLLSTGETVPKDKVPPGAQIVNTRKTKVPVIKWCKLNGVEVLSETVWPGQWIPIIPVIGDELDVNGKRVLEGVIRHAKDSQRMYNYWASTETETIALAPKAPYIVAEGQIPKEYQAAWRTANSKNHAYLEYKPTSVGGIQAGPPQRQVYEAPVQAITGARMQAADDLKATTGIYDSALGSSGNEKSGVAIQRRNIQSQTSNFHFIDNLTRSLRHSGRIIVDLIPHVYDSARAERILGEDGEASIVALNQVFQEKNGEVKKYDLGLGRYDVAIETGPSFATKRQEALSSMLDLTRSYTQMVSIVGDLMMKNMDFPGATEMAERFKKTLPPNLLADPKDGPPPLPPQAKAQMDQMHQMIGQLTQHLNDATDKLKTNQLTLESRERIELAKLETQARIELLKLSVQDARHGLELEIANLDRRQDLLHFGDPIQFQQQQDLSGAGPQQAAPPQAEPQQPTGGLPPGPNNIGV
jgi:hypothetical protein